MFHWPILSAIVGISSNLFFIALVCILSYLHFTYEEPTAETGFEYEKGDPVDEDPKSNSDSEFEEWFNQFLCLPLVFLQILNISIFYFVAVFPSFYSICDI